jgi:hypothetical protein
MPASSTIDLLKLFQTAGKTLGKNRESLNQADEYNHDHGDNMVQIFNVITDAVKAKKNAEPADQLAYASQLLQQRSKSGSAQFYTQGLSNAAQKFQGKQVTKDNAVQLIQTLLGGGQPAQAAQQPSGSAGADLLGALLGGGQSAQGQQSSGSAGADLLGALLGGGQSAQGQQSSGSAGTDLLGALLGGGQSTASQQPAASADNDVLGSLLSGLVGGGGSQQGSDGLDAGDLLSAGLAYMQAKQQGKSTLEALVSAVLSGSQLNNSPYRSQSGQMVANALLQAVATMAK